MSVTEHTLTDRSPDLLGTSCIILGFPGDSVVKNPCYEGAVQSLIEELKSRMPCSMGPPKTNKKEI